MRRGADRARALLRTADYSGAKVKITHKDLMTDRLIDTFASVLGVAPDTLSEASSPGNPPEWDSLATVNLTLALEREFSVRLSIRETRKMSTIGLAREVLRNKGISGI